MKLAAGQLAGFLRRLPDDVAAVLLYGPDEGLVRERADAVVQAVLGAADDPFRLTQLAAEALRQDPARLADEAAALSMIGGRRVLRIRDASDALAKPLGEILKWPQVPALILLEGGDLGKPSTLRRLAETAASAAAIACYADGPRELAELVRGMLRERRIAIAEDALHYLVQNLGGDRLVTRQEIEKLMLFAGDGGAVSLADAMTSVGDTSALALEDVAYDALDGRTAQLEAGLGRLLLAGQSPVAVLRAAQRHVQRLHLCAARIAGGEPVDAAVQALSPPVFFKNAARFRAQLASWPEPRARRLLSLLTRAELDCKTTGFPEEAICRHVLAGAARLPGRPERR